MKIDLELNGVEVYAVLENDQYDNDYVDDVETTRMIVELVARLQEYSSVRLNINTVMDCDLDDVEYDSERDDDVDLGELPDEALPYEVDGYVEVEDNGIKLRVHPNEQYGYDYVESQLNTKQDMKAAWPFPAATKP
jgi:hypothetical protein